MDSLTQRLESMSPLQRAVFALKETQARVEMLERQRNEPIAIVGMGCRFPGGANDAASFWQALCHGVDAVREIPPDRWDLDDFFDTDPTAPGKMNTRWAGLLDRIDEFDNHFFGISDREAVWIDPQHRMLLEVAWEALEDAGLRPSALRGSRTGVFIGISVSDYGIILAGDRAQTDSHAATGTSLCLAPNRLSFVFGFQGPSVALDTACSSALVAVHLACQSLRNGECTLALAGGTSLLLSPSGSVNLTKAGFSSPDGRIRAFDAAANGYVRGEGSGLVVLKPLSAALKDDDPIYAVILATAVNQNGTSNGLTAPSRAGQEQVLREAYSRAKVSPGQVQFVETQGTGTRLGDAIEAMALGSVLAEGRAPQSRCAIGSAKTNFGHLEAAAGAVSLMKAALALTHRQLPPNLHFETPNPDIPFDRLPLKVQCELEPWPDSPGPRLAGVSAFGFGGSNAHLVLQEAPARPDHADGTPGRHRYLLPLSARTEKALEEQAKRYVEFLSGDAPAWRDVCHTASQRRDHHDCRLAVLAGSKQRAVELLRALAGGELRPGVFRGRKPFGRGLKTALVYGSEAVAWQPHLVEIAAIVAGASLDLEEIDAALRRAAGATLAMVLNEKDRWSDPAFARPALVALQLVLTAWWRGVGVAPEVVVGRGVGELAAAWAARMLTAEEALRIAAAGSGRELAAVLDKLESRPASLPFLSGADGRLHRGADASHWQLCLDSCDGWSAALAALRSRNVDLCLEVGPGFLANPSAPGGKQSDGLGLIVPSFSPGEGDLLAAVGALCAAGADVVWQRVGPAQGRCVRLPGYPWQRQRLWPAVKNWLTQPLRDTADESSKSSAAPAREPLADGVAPQPRSRPELTVPYVPPRTPIEQQIADSWSALLGIDRIGVHDNFFELGGDSLQATILLNRLREELNEAIPAEVLFQVQTIADLASYLEEHYPAASAIPQLARDDRSQELLDRLDELTDDQVESLLSEAAVEGEASHE